MPDGLAYGLSAVLAWGLTDICAALASRRIGGLATVAIVQATSLGGLVLFALAVTGGLPFDSHVAPRAFGLGMISAIGYISFFTALGLGPIAVVSPVASAYGGLTVVLAVILLGETLLPRQAIGAGLATIGILTVGLRSDGHWRTTRFVGRGVPLAMLALVVWAFMTIGTTVLVREAAVLPVLLAARAGNALTVWVLVGVRHAVRRSDPLPPDLPSRILAFGLLAGLLDVAGYIVYANGLQRSLAWLVGLSSSFGPTVAVVIAVVVLGDRLRPIQWGGLAALAVGVVLIGLR